MSSTAVSEWKSLKDLEALVQHCLITWSISIVNFLRTKGMKKKIHLFLMFPACIVHQLRIKDHLSRGWLTYYFFKKSSYIYLHKDKCVNEQISVISDKRWLQTSELNSNLEFDERTFFKKYEVNGILLVFSLLTKAIVIFYILWAKWTQMKGEALRTEDVYSN